MKICRRSFINAASLTAATSLTAPVVQAQSSIQWRMVTSWPRNLPGPGVTAQRLADAITKMSGGRLEVKLYAAGEIVPALEVLSAVSSGVAQIGHSASLFWGGTIPAAPLFTAGPFGLTPLEHITWIDHGGGQQIWDDLYEPLGVKPLMAGNTGSQMGGWFKKPVTGLQDLQGLRIRMPGLGGAVMRKLGASPVTLAPGEILTALQAGTIDAAEFLGPSSDFAMGFHKAADNYYTPGWHEPNGTGEALISLAALDQLPDNLRAIVLSACAAENIYSLGESEWQNAEQLRALIESEKVKIRDFPEDVLQAARQASDEVLDDLADRDDLTKAAVNSFRAARDHQKNWSDVSVQKFTAARSR